MLTTVLLLLATSLVPACLAAGEKVPVDPSEIDANITQLALLTLEMGSNNFNARKIVQITNATKQVVSGMSYTFTLELAHTECKKPQGDKLEDLRPIHPENCLAKPNTPTESCTVTVWSKPWQNFLKVTDSKCGLTNPPVTHGKDKASSVDAGSEKKPGQSEQVIDLIANVHKVGKKILNQGDDGDKIVRQKLKQLMHDERSLAELRELQSHSNFKSFVKTHKRSYRTSKEYKRRYSAFRQNMKIIQFLRETEQASGQYGVTQFADYTEQEKKRFLGFKPEMRLPGSLPKMEEDEYANVEDLPEEFDWTEKGAVTPVKNQGSCGSCWAFSVTGNVEGMWKVKTGDLVSLSEQELVDCDKTDNGCNGGLPSNAYQAIVKLGGMETETDYKYDGYDEQCKFNKSEVKVTISGGIELSKDEKVLQAWLVKNGPISVGLNANAMMFYYGGVSHPWKFLCRSSGLDHGVLIVGYGVVKLPSLDNQPFWKIKNSWGESWGEAGYYRLWRGDGACGVNEMATSAVP